MKSELGLDGLKANNNYLKDCFISITVSCLEGFKQTHLV